MLGDLHYGRFINVDLVSFMGSLAGTVVDVGCAAGEWAPLLRASGAHRLIGLEPTDDAEVAREHYDVVHRAAIEDTPSVGDVADMVIAAHVLEHLADPWAALRRFRSWSAPAGRLVVAVPNAQNIDVWGTLIRGDFPAHADGGIWDRTHLRWFTATSLGRTLLETGWQVERVAIPTHGKRARVASLRRQTLEPFLGSQLLVDARPS